MSQLAPRDRRVARWLRPFGDVHADEVGAFLLFGCNAFLMMTAYYVMKTAREPLILLSGGARIPGAELKTYATAAQALLLLAFVPLYGRLVAGVKRLRLVQVTVGVLIGSLAVFALAGAFGLPIGIPFYLWLGMTSLIAGAQFWSFANDYYTRPAGERLFPLIAAGGTLGAIAGSGLARALLARLGVIGLMPVASALLVLYAFVFHLIERLPTQADSTLDHGERPIGGSNGLLVLSKDRYLLLIGLMVLVSNLVNTTGEFMLARAVTEEAAARVPAPAGMLSEAVAASLREARGEMMGRLYGEYYGGVNLLGFVIQMFVVSRLFKHLGVARAIYLVPLVALTAYGSVLAVPAFLFIATAKTVENGTDYSLHNTVRQALFLPTRREAKYQGKAAVDSLFVRAGDLCAAGAVFAGVHVFGLSVRQFALSNVVLIGLWLVVVTFLARGYRELAGGP